MALTSPMYRCTGIQQGGGGGCEELIDGTATSITTNATKVKQHCFYGDSTIESFIGNNVTQIGDSAFRNATNLSNLSLGALTKIDGTAFYSAGKSGYTFDLVLNNAVVASQAMQGSRIRNVTGTWSSSAGSALRACTSLRKVEFNLARLPSYFLYGCTGLQEIYLSYDQAVVTLDGSSCLTNVPNTCKVYVPSALVSSYEADSNWSRFDIQALPT